MSREYRSDDEAARAKIAALEAELHEHETKLSSLLFSRTPTKPVWPRRESSEDPSARSQLMNFVFMAAAPVTFFCYGMFRAGGLLFLALGLLACIVFLSALWLIIAALRGLDARPSSSPNRRPEEAAAMAALIADRESRTESLQSQLTSERAACDDLRKRIEEAELLLNEDEAVKNRESSR